MKIKKVFGILLVAILILSLIGIILVHSVSKFKKNESDEKWIYRNGMEDEKIVLSDEKKTEIQLKYNKSRRISSEDMVDIYLDEAENEYRFKNGKLNSFYSNASLIAKNSKEKQQITNEKAIEIAKAHARAYYGNEIELFSLERVYEDQALGTMNVEFYMRYGKDDFIYGPSLSVYISKSGTVIGSANSNGTVYSTFDEKSIEDIKYEEIEQFIERKVRAAFGDNYRSYAIDKVKLEYANERFFLRSITEVERIVEGQTISTSEVYDYEIKQ